MLTKYHGMFAVIHCDELTGTVIQNANICNLSHSAPENHFYI